MSDDEHDDNNVFDKLKSIKAFTVDQLYLLHPDVGCPPKPVASEQVETNIDTVHDTILYQNLVDYEKLRYELNKIREQVKRLHRELCDQIGKVWYFNKEEIRKIEVCKHGRIVEETYKYKQAFTNAKQLNVLGLSFRELSEVITKDYIHLSYESQVKRHRIVTQLAAAYQTDDLEKRSTGLKLAISTLIDFLKHGKSKSEFVTHCQKWLRCLVKRFLEEESTRNYRFVIAQLCKGPVGTAHWSADLIERKPFSQVTEFESAPQYITHCCELLAELFNNLKLRLRTLALKENQNTNQEQNWLLEDPRFNCAEELSGNFENVLSETDVIKLCLRVPVVQIFRAYVKDCLNLDGSMLETNKNYEFVMLKLLTIGTIIVKTYQLGLEIFNSIIYSNLIEYLSSQIRRTVIILSDQWNEFKRRLKGVDNGLLMRLQVEYDNFILRSILIILELRQSGIWRHLAKTCPDDDQGEGSGYDFSTSWSTESIRPALSKILQVTGLKSVVPLPVQDTELGDQLVPRKTAIRSSTSLTNEFSLEWFKEVSEPMLWHILWQFYHNGFVNSCDYHSDNYWLEKFKDNSSIYLFLKKIQNSPLGECNYLLNSITSMVLSRSRHDSKLVSFIATEIYNLSFLNDGVKEKINKKGIQCLTKCLERFPNLMDLLLTFMDESDVDENVVKLVKGCSLSGWIFDDEGLAHISKWLVEYPLTSSRNKIARLLISKVLLNNAINNQLEKVPACRGRKISKAADNSEISRRVVDLKLKRRLALLFYEASVRHLPEPNEYGSQSLGTFVEVALGSVFCDRKATSGCDLLDLSIDTSYQQFYIWIWRLLFTFKLHIINQAQTDWNDVQSRSGTSRSIKNTVILNDSFHPVPSIQDTECQLLIDGIKSNHPLASFIYLSMTDASWQTDTLGTCLTQLNVMAGSGHLTPSLMSMKFLTICHLNDLAENVAKDLKTIEFFTTIMTSNCDANQIASLIQCQFQHLKQYRQIQLSNFYIRVLLEVATNIDKQLSSSWFSNSEHSLEKIACILDYLAKFNFTTQRLEIIRKFYDCSYSVQSNKSSGASGSGWFGSLFTANSSNANSTRREFLTMLHLLSQKFKKYTWLRWITTECDALRLEKIWEDLVLYLSTNDGVNLDSAIKKVCPHVNASILKSTLPIHSWLEQIFDIVESDWSHPLCPLILYNFFLNYFSNSLNGVSVGHKLVPQETLNELKTKLDALHKRHSYKHLNHTPPSAVKQNSLAQLYRAYRLWLDDPSLQDAYIDMDKLGHDYLVSLLKAVLESSVEDSCVQYIDIQSIDIQNRNLGQIWASTTRLGTEYLTRSFILVESDQDETAEILDDLDNNEVSDAAALFATSSSHGETSQDISDKRDSPSIMDEEIITTQQQDETTQLPLEEIVKNLKRNSEYVFKESSIFESNIRELAKIKSEVIELITQLYTNKKREVKIIKSCSEGPSECSTEIKFDIDEAKIDARRSECLQDRQRQCKAIICELLALPSGKIVRSTIAIEDRVRNIVKDNDLAKSIIKILLNWMSEPDAYRELNGCYYVANQLLNSTLEILSQTEETDIFNNELMEICLKHLGGVEIFSPHLSPSNCSRVQFLVLYKKIIEHHSILSQNAMFVLLSKFKVDTWLNENTSKDMYHELIRATCSGLKSMGKYPDDEFVLSYDLYRCHIQRELASPDRRKPEEISLVLREFLNIMDEQSLAPSLWIDIMAILGLEKRTVRQRAGGWNGAGSGSPGKGPGGRDESVNSVAGSVINEPLTVPQITNLEYDESSIANLLSDISRFAERQTIFDYHALCGIIKMLCQFFEERQQTLQITLLEFYQDYLDQFSLVMLSLTFMWLRSTGEHYPDNHELTWAQFMALWQHWVFLTKNCQNVGKTSYSLLATQFVASLRYMIERMPDNEQLVLRSILSALADYVGTTKEVVYLELTILQRSLKSLPWSSLVVTRENFEDLASLSEQSNFNVSDLVSHILLQANLKDSLTKIYEDSDEQDSLPHVVERLATAIVLQSTHLRSFRLHGSFFALIPVDKISRIASLILPRMEFANLEHSQNNKLLVKLLRFMCIRFDITSSSTTTANSSQQRQDTVVGNSQLVLKSGGNEDNDDDFFERSLIYARFVSSYLVDLIKNHPAALKNHKDYIRAVIDNTLQDLKILSSPDVQLQKKIATYEALLECCNSKQISEEYRLLLAESLMEASLLKDRPIIVMELFHAIGQILSDACVLVYTIERMIGLYLGMNGHYEKVWKSFCLKVLPSDLYLEACLEERTPLALLVYFEALCHNGTEESTDHETTLMNNNNRIWTSFLHWLTQISVPAATTATSGSGGAGGYANNGSMSEAAHTSRDTKLIIAWLKLLDLFELNLEPLIQYKHNHRQLSETATDESASLSEATDDVDKTSSTAADESQTASASVAGEEQQQTETAAAAAFPAVAAEKDADTKSTKSVVQQQVTPAATKLHSKKSSAHKVTPPLPMTTGQRSVVEFVKKMLSFYESYNSGGFWSYLKSALSEEAARVSLAALAVACFLATRTLACLSNSKIQPDPSQALLSSRSPLNPATWLPVGGGGGGGTTAAAAGASSGGNGGSSRSSQFTRMPAHLSLIYDEMTKLRKACLSKLDGARKAKHYLKSAHFIEALMESVKQDNRVQYSEGLQLITTFVESSYSSSSISSSMQGVGTGSSSSSSSREFASLQSILTRFN